MITVEELYATLDTAWADPNFNKGWSSPITNTREGIEEQLQVFRDRKWVAGCVFYWNPEANTMFKEAVRL